ncbi:hypothetical protein CAPTEDRAFT_192236 [Capitella teleta]|uniref:Uncharacterized protein n=1 Tax=Capitella teleta TaxID=283909 RepID=R7UMM3_CAPTE|nr:hypothetical protein CAPTEDRAFT_192236 [Capitella teleta]|eukprot:ELU04497.1 hypothetical protein CAPTEDRAFT_192236 [Capitella teleta]
MVTQTSSMVNSGIGTSLFKTKWELGINKFTFENTEGIYPSSIIRNLALEEVFTEYAFLSDVDFMPAPSVYKTSVDLIKSKNRLLSKTTAFVVAAFELKRNTTPDGDAVKFPRNKSDLLALQNSTLIQPFHYHRERHYGHFSTNYEAWNIAKTTYKAKWVGLYEPYVIVNTCAVPRYNKAFVGRYFDKYSHLLELYSAGYEFWVLPNVFVVHLPHENQKDGIGQSK